MTRRGVVEAPSGMSAPPISETGFYWGWAVQARRALVCSSRPDMGGGPAKAIALEPEHAVTGTYRIPK
jgi:hypothetical protein